MIPGYTSFEVEIKKLKFETSNGYRYAKTAILTFTVQDRSKPLIAILGYMDEEEIYKRIDEGEYVVLDECYVARFSLEHYRSSRKLEAKTPVKIKGFSAKNSFFDSSLPFDFSYAIFDSEDFDLSSTWINRGAFRFEHARFKVKKVSFHDVKFADYDFEFTNVRLSGGELTFKNAIFGNAEKDFQYSQFHAREISFINTDFSSGDVNFINADFGDADISFKVARFGNGRVDFHYSKFKNGNISFERTDFGNGRTDFRTIEFGHGKVNFNRARFGDGELTFEASEMDSGKFSFKRVEVGDGEVNFEQVIFPGVDVSFERSRFGKGKITFLKSVFHSLAFNFCHFNDYMDLRVQKCQSIDLSDTIIRDIVDLSPHDFTMELESVRLAGVRLIGRIYIDWQQNHVKRLILNQGESNYRVRAEQFRILKENFNACGQYEDEDHAYVEFKRNETRANLRQSISARRINAFWSIPVFWFKELLFDRAGLYATSPIRVLTTMVTVFIFFSLVYILMILAGTGDIIASVDDSLTVVARSFYHSAITFLTIGYGDHYPFKAIRWVSSVEGFAGLFLMSYFTVAFVRKVLR